MSEDLVCAACSGRVVDGGCPTCRSSRELLRPDPLPAGPVLALALLVVLLLVLLAH